MARPDQIPGQRATQLPNSIGGRTRPHENQVGFQERAKNLRVIGAEGRAAFARWHDRHLHLVILQANAQKSATRPATCAEFNSKPAGVSRTTARSGRGRRRASISKIRAAGKRSLTRTKQSNGTKSSMHRTPSLFDQEDYFQSSNAICPTFGRRCARALSKIARPCSVRVKTTSPPPTYCFQ